MTEREQLTALIKEVVFPAFPGGGMDVKVENQLPEHGFQAIADHLINHGVTFATDNHVGGKWIPVTERLPEIYEKDPNWSATVLFRTEQGHIHSGYRNIGKPQTSFYDDDWTPPYWLDESENLSFEEGEVTHWMPLPEPPKEGDG